MTVGVVTVETFPPLQIFLSTQTAPLLPPFVLPLSGLGPSTSTSTVSADLRDVRDVGTVCTITTFLDAGARNSGRTEVS